MFVESISLQTPTYFRRPSDGRNNCLHWQARRVFTCLRFGKLCFFGHVLQEYIKHGSKSTLERKDQEQSTFKFLTSVYLLITPCNIKAYKLF